MRDKVNLAEKFAQLPDAYQPAIVGYMNDYKLVVVKTQGEFVWHKHDETDELFLIVKGRLKIQFRDRDVVLEPGELFVVPRGVEHCPQGRRGNPTCCLIEPAGNARIRATRAASARCSRIEDLGRLREQSIPIPANSRPGRTPSAGGTSRPARRGRGRARRSGA